MFDLRLNGVPVVFSVGQETELGESLKGSEHFTTCRTIEELNVAISAYSGHVRPYWRLVVELQEDLSHPENAYLKEDLNDED